MNDTDLSGKPLTPRPAFVLNKWQKRQATLLNHFSSLDYLKGLKRLLDDFVNGVDVTLGLAERQGRDELIVNKRWGMRDTAANFGTYGFPALREFQKSVAKQIAQLANDYYHATGFIQCARLLDELSLGWSTPEEEARFKAGLATIGKYVDPLDTTMEHAWNDNRFTRFQERNPDLLPRIGKFRVRTGVEGESGKLPPRSGIYVPQDDPYGALQFAWTGNNDGRLFDCSTFNELGLKAIALVGREALWTDDPRLLALVKQAPYLAAFKARRFPIESEQEYLADPANATVLISVAGVTDRPCKWYLVEHIEGEFDDEADLEEPAGAIESHRSNVPAGQPCPEAGWWFTPAAAGSRRFFRQGERMPDAGGAYGETFWQWDRDQSAPSL